MHDLFFKDPWAEGKECFAKKDILLIQSERVRCLELKSKVRRRILNGIEELASCSESVWVGKEMNVHPTSNLMAKAAFIFSYRLPARSFSTASTASRARLYIG